VALEKFATVGFLPQENAAAGEETVLQLACAGSLESHAIDEHSAWEIEPKAKRILAGLAFRESDFHRAAKTMSGGWIMRAHLARLLVMEPDLLLLDEPTNHLDLESLVWFQEYLRNYPGAILMISHDREFLNQLVGSIVEIAHRRLNRYRGNWDRYVEEKAAREEQQLAAYKNQQREIASLQQFADRFRAKASKASQAQSKLKQIERMEKIEAPLASEKSVAKFRSAAARSGSRVITLKDGTRARRFGRLSRLILRPNAASTALVGPNGAGKSTLKLLAGVFRAGARELGYNVKVGPPQHRVEMLTPPDRPRVQARDAPNPCSITARGPRLVPFRGDDVPKPVAVLSGGEKSGSHWSSCRSSAESSALTSPRAPRMSVRSTRHRRAETIRRPSSHQHDVHFTRAIAKTVLHISAAGSPCG
jgi:ATP-binding cassette subfamily F protein 3